MRIPTYLNTTKEEVEGREHNIWIGVSLGNKYFTRENVRQYIEWALLHTKDRVLVVIGDAIHAINLEVLDSRSKDNALSKAMRMGDVKYAEVEEILSTFPEKDRAKVSVARWNDVMEDEQYRKNLDAIRTEFESNEDFHRYITDIVKGGRQDRAERLAELTPSELGRLADYVLFELAHFINGIRKQGEDTVHTLLPYPGLNELDDLCVDLIHKTAFKELAEKLDIQHNIAIIEAYVD